MKTQYITGLLCSLFLIACKPEPIEVTMPESKPAMAVASQYIREGVLGICLSRSFGSSETPVKQTPDGRALNTELLISGAHVYLEGPGGTFTLPEVSPGIYGLSDFFLEDLQQYTLHAEKTGYPALHSAAVKLKPVLPDTLFLKRGNPDVFHIEFTDNLQEKNYYVINYLLPNANEPLPEKPTPDDIVNRLLNQQASFDLIDDATLAESHVVLERKFSQLQSDSFLVSLSNISAEYYHFLLAQKKAGSLFNQLRGEVINFPGNVSGGYGFFTLHDPSFQLLIRE